MEEPKIKPSLLSREKSPHEYSLKGTKKSLSTSKSDPLTVSYYTQNTHYEKEAKDLALSCKRFNIDHHIEPIQTLGSWEKNCLFKPQFIRKMLLQFRRPIVWIDADALYVKPAPLFNKLTCDIAATSHHHLPSHHPSKILSGTLYFRPTLAAFNLLDHWELRCLSGGWDQTHLRDTLFALKNEITFFPIPTTYTMIYDNIATEEELRQTVILHFQASRYAKKVIDGELFPIDLPSSKELSGFSL